jgi:hypothetical protein
MCLTINKNLTKKHSSLKTNEKHTFYKIFEIENGELTTYYQNTKIEHNLETIELEDFFINITENEIHEGVFHAFTKKLNNGDNLIHLHSLQNIQIPITVESNDIVAFGQNDDVCFTKYKISKQSWNLIHKRIKKINF